ncbi:hypothetical protein F5148DRAFT_178031 [Russula earlei]|uniref:Uncharacterized protein n=1 Tax=Russula earlei TaxID=71964 RepID=A0ACC0UM15_9AGAM|nr:hypothetical protein F5148DRAFT_178031 [Russula earlei]
MFQESPAPERMSNSANMLNMPASDEEHRDQGPTEAQKRLLRHRMLEINEYFAVRQCAAYRNLLLTFLGDVDAPRMPPQLAPAPEAAAGSPQPAAAVRAPCGLVGLDDLDFPNDPFPLTGGDDPGPSRAGASGSGHRRGGSVARTQRHLIDAGSSADGLRGGPLHNAADRDVAAPVARLGAVSYRFSSTAAVQLFLCEEGLEAPSLTPQDYALAKSTPDVTFNRFVELFGGSPTTERPKSRLKVVCVNRELHPFAPASPGRTGVLFVLPNTSLYSDTYETFHIFVNMSSRSAAVMAQICTFRYLGTYTKVPVACNTVEVDEWHRLPQRSHGPPQCRNLWLNRISSVSSPDVRAIHARVAIHKKRPHGPPPSPEEIDEWLEENPGRRNGLKWSELGAAFNSGEEKFGFEVVRCVRFDVEVARKLKGRLRN